MITTKQNAAQQSTAIEQAGMIERVLAGEPSGRAEMKRLWCACLLSLLLAPASQALAQQPGMRYQVVIEAMRFEPAQLTVKPGDVVEWVNRDAFPHTATAAGKFDTGEIAPGASKSLKIMGKGAIAYVCALHPTMKAQLTVR